MRAIFAVDGGNATGIAMGLFDDSLGSVKEAIASRSHLRSFTINRKMKRNGKTVIDGEHLEDHIQVEAIYAEFMRFKRMCYNDKLCELDEIDLVIEDFILLPGMHAGGKDGVASVRIAWGIVGYQMGISGEWAKRHRHYHITPIIWQPPSVMGRITDDYLRIHGLWVPGRDHERAAIKHIVARLNTVTT